MKKLLIVGAGGFGRMIYDWVSDMQKIKRKWDSVEFLDDDLKALDFCNSSHKIVGTIREYMPKPGEEVICAFGDPLLKTKISQSLLERGAVFTNVIHPTALLSESCKIGNDVIIGPGSVICANAEISDVVVINCLTTIGHEAVVERGCVISAHCDIMGFSHLEENVFLGSGARILPSVKVGKSAKVGAGSVVIKNVKADTSVFGNPAKKIYRPE